MLAFFIKDQSIEIDETKEYLDFYIQEGKPMFVNVGLVKIFQAINTGEFQIDQDFIEYLTYLERWNLDVPRKKFYRQMRLDGGHVLSGEYFFENVDNADEIFAGLQNTGDIAKKVLEIVAPERVGAYWKLHNGGPL